MSHLPAARAAADLRASLLQGAQRRADRRATRRRWALFAAAWLGSAVISMFAMGYPLQNSELTFWILWPGYVLITGFFGAVLTVLASPGRRVP